MPCSFAHFIPLSLSLAHSFYKDGDKERESEIYLALLLVVVKLSLGAIFEFESLQQQAIVHPKMQQLNLFEISSSG